MSLIEISAVVLAVGIVFAPQVLGLVSSAAGVLTARRPATGIGYQAAMASLAQVRHRLLATNSGEIPKDAAAAIEVITHALVEGSDR